MKTKHYLEQALRSMPGDNAFQGARSYITAAINQINAVEYKRLRRQNTQDQIAKIEERKQEAQKLGVPVWKMSLPMARAAVKNLDIMIQTELAKIAETKANKKIQSEDNDKPIYN